MALKDTGMERGGGKGHLLAYDFGGKPYTYTHAHMLTYTHTKDHPYTNTISKLHTRTNKNSSDSI